jgi:hypothetical protein
LNLKNSIYAPHQFKGVSKIMRTIFAAIAIFTASVPLAGQQVNFSGTWKLNLGSSFLGADHPSSDYELTKVLLQEGRTIHQTDIGKHVSIVNIPLPDSHVSTDLIADGEEHDAQAPPPFPGMPPAKLEVTAEWQGNTLLVKERSADAAPPSSAERRYFLSEDGVHLIELVETHNAFGDSEQRLVFDK